MVRQQISKSVLISDSGSLFVDGFESADFSHWTGTRTTTGSFAGVISEVFSNGSFSASFSVNTGSGTRRSYSYTDLGGLTELHTYAYVYIDDGLTLTSDQKMWLIQFADFGQSTIVSFGISNDGIRNKMGHAVRWWSSLCFSFAFDTS